jgi:hypothetical protein
VSPGQSCTVVSVPPETTSTRAAKLLTDDTTAAEERLRELCRSDVALLCGGPYNPGALYVLPEVQAGRFAGFHRVRAQLKEAYGTLPAATRAGAALDEQEPALRADLAFGLIEGVILVLRSGPDRPVAAFAETTADAALRIVATERA